jgi:PIN domain nuclease of toxin-antitoxin system
MMNILLDTNVLLWYVQNHDLLPDIFKQQILYDENTIFVSMASLQGRMMRR